MHAQPAANMEDMVKLAVCKNTDPASSDGSSLRKALLEHGANSPTCASKYLSRASLLFAAEAQSSTIVCKRGECKDNILMPKRL